jgi:hypothetical protein
MVCGGSWVVSSVVVDSELELDTVYLDRTREMIWRICEAYAVVCDNDQLGISAAKADLSCKRPI